jgi:4-amino-4-deoxy-L-arabinose transferase-like glycosyltransferase
VPRNERERPPASPGASSLGPPEGRSFDRVLLALTVAGFAARAALLLVEPRCDFAGDEASWVALGTQEIGRPRRGLSPFRVPLIFYPPLYPWLVAILYRLLGSLSAVLWLQAALGALLVPAVGRAGRLALGARVGLGAAAVVAFYPDFVWFSVHFWSEMPFVLFLWWGIERVLHADSIGSKRTAAMAGVFWGLATLTRELALYLAPFAAAWLVRDWLFRDRAGVKADSRPAPGWARAGAFLLTLVLTLAPWTLRNAIVFNAFIPVSTMGGSNLWQGNVPLTHIEVHETLDRVGDPVERDRHARKLAWEAIRARQPLWIFEKLGEQMPEFWKAGSEILDHLVGREACGPLPASTVRRVEVLVVLPYLILLAPFLVGLVRMRWSAGAVLMLVLLVAWNLAHVVAYATTRFRLPMLPVVFCFGAGAVLGRREGSLAPLRGWRLGLLVILVALAVLVLAPGLEELLTWRRLTGRPPLP